MVEAEGTHVEGSTGGGLLLMKQMAAGGLAGMTADGVTYPMMTVKSRMQVQGAMAAACSPRSYTYSGPANAMWTIATREGWRALFKGFGTVIQVAPAQALYMGSYQAARVVLPGDEDSAKVQFFGGIVATLGQSLLMVPLEVVRQRQQVQTGTEGAYQGSMDAARKIYRAEGIKALYRGFGITQLVWGPFNAIFLPLWEGSKRLGIWHSGAGSLKELDVKYELAASFGSSSVAAALTNPMDVVKTRLQVQGKSNVASSTAYKGPMDAFRSIMRTEGLAGFTGGMTSRVLWVAPSTMIMFTAYDQLMKLIH